MTQSAAACSATPSLATLATTPGATSAFTSTRTQKNSSALLLIAILSGVLIVSSTGCYYGHLAVGQVKLLLARQSVDQLLADPATDTELRRKLQLVQRARDFAVVLGLEVQGQYTSYVPWRHDRIITSIIATRPGTIEASNFRFPIIGAVPYKGYFDQERAEREAARLRIEGLDVCLGAISAYSTLGWFDDPLTAPMLNASSGRLVETVIHELVHANVFVKSQPNFNEGVANFIGEEAVVLFYADKANSTNDANDADDVLNAYPSGDDEQRRSNLNKGEVDPRDRIRDDRLIAVTLMSLRDEIAELYAADLSEQDRQLRRAELETSGRRALGDLALTSRSAARLAERARINDACLAIQGTYVSDTPRHLEVLAQLDGDLVGPCRLIEMQ